MDLAHGYMLYSLGYTAEYWIHWNQAKPGGFGAVKNYYHDAFKIDFEPD